MIRTICLTLAAAGALGCASTATGTVSGDIYEMRLAIENLQDVTEQNTSDMNTQFANLRAAQSQDIDRLRQQVNMLQQAVQELSDRVSAAEPGRVTRTVVLPPDPDSAAARGPAAGPSTTITMSPPGVTPAPVVTPTSPAPALLPPSAPSPTPLPGQPLYYHGAPSTPPVGQPGQTYRR